MYFQLPVLNPHINQYIWFLGAHNFNISDSATFDVILLFYRVENQDSEVSVRQTPG